MYNCRFLQAYNIYKQPFCENQQVTVNIEEENTIISYLFKRQHVETNELEVYLALPIATEQIEPLQWWKINNGQFPILAQMAYDYLAIPATSVPSERCFSIGRNLITHNRSRLSGKAIKVSMCLKSWWTNYPELN